MGRLSTDVLCRGLEKNGMVGAWHGHGMASVNQTRPHSLNQVGKTQSKPLAARHGRGTAWARHAMCESAFNCHNTQVIKYNKGFSSKHEAPLVSSGINSYLAVNDATSIIESTGDRTAPKASGLGDNDDDDDDLRN